MGTALPPGNGARRAPSTVYLGQAALDQITSAQAEVDRHVAVGPDGRCLDCGAEEPCPPLRAAAAVLTRYGRLPARRPGLASRAIRGSAGDFDWLPGRAPAIV